MGSDTEVFRAERGLGVLAYRWFIGLSMAAIITLGGWNLSETHSTAMIVRGLDQHVKDSDREQARIANAVSDLGKTVQDIRDHEVQDIRDRQARLDTRVSIIETEIERKKP